MFSLKSAKQAYSKIYFAQQHLAKSSVRLSQCNSLYQANMATYRTAARKPMAMVQVQTRAFSLPDHLVMEMPNLSPTMEKVSRDKTHGANIYQYDVTKFVLAFLISIGQHQELEQEDWRRNRPW